MWRRKTRIKIRNHKGRNIARVSEMGSTNEGVEALIYNRKTGSLLIRHYGEPITVSGTVRGDLNSFGNVNYSFIRTGGSLYMSD